MSECVGVDLICCGMCVMSVLCNICNAAVRLDVCETIYDVRHASLWICEDKWVMCDE